MAWCEAHRVDFVFGLARNARLVEEHRHSSSPGRRRRPTRRLRRAAFATSAGPRSTAGPAGGASSARPNGPVARPTHASSSPRCVPREIDARSLYERIYCARGEMENRIKECQLDLFAGRAPAATMRANQLRLWFASMAYGLLCALRRIGLAHTELARPPAAATPEAAQDRRAGDGERAPRQVRAGLGLPVPRRLRRRQHPAATSRGLRPPDPPVHKHNSKCAEPAPPAIAAATTRAWQRCSTRQPARSSARHTL